METQNSLFGPTEGDRRVNRAGHDEVLHDHRWHLADGELPGPQKETEGMTDEELNEWLEANGGNILPGDPDWEPDENEPFEVTGEREEEPWDIPVANFPPVSHTVNHKTLYADGPFIEQDEADALFEQWKAKAKEIGETEDNSDKVVISLFDASGVISQPWADAGYNVVRYDKKHGDDLLFWFPMADLNNIKEAGFKRIIVLTQPPCTTFTNSATKWRDRHDNPDRNMVEKMWGAEAAEYFDTPKEYNRAMVSVVDLAADILEPDVLLLENPEGRIAKETGLPKPVLRFNPHNYGDPYTKKTQLHGKFNPELPLANVFPVEGSKMHKMSSKSETQDGLRSLTSERFAYAFFMANHESDSEPTSQEPPKEVSQDFPKPTGNSQQKSLFRKAMPSIRYAAPVCTEAEAEKPGSDLSGQTGDAIKSLIGQETGPANFHDDYAASLHEEISGKLNKSDGEGHAHDLSDQLGHRAVGYETPHGSIAVQPPRFDGDKWSTHYIAPEKNDAVSEDQSLEAEVSTPGEDGLPENSVDTESDDRDSGIEGTPDDLANGDAEDNGSALQENDGLDFDANVPAGSEPEHFDDWGESDAIEPEAEYEYEHWGFPRDEQANPHEWPKSHGEAIESHLRDSLNIHDASLINGIKNHWHDTWQNENAASIEYNRAHRNVMESIAGGDKRQTSRQRADGSIVTGSRDTFHEDMAKLRKAASDSLIDSNGEYVHPHPKAGQMVPGWENAIVNAIDPDNAAFGAGGGTFGTPEGNWDYHASDIDTDAIGNKIIQGILDGRREVSPAHGEGFETWLWSNHGEALQRYANKEPHRKERTYDETVYDDDGNAIPFNKQSVQLRAQHYKKRGMPWRLAVHYAQLELFGHGKKPIRPPKQSKPPKPRIAKSQPESQGQLFHTSGDQKTLMQPTHTMALPGMPGSKAQHSPGEMRTNPQTGKSETLNQSHRWELTDKGQGQLFSDRSARLEEIDERHGSKINEAIDGLAAMKLSGNYDEKEAGNLFDQAENEFRRISPDLIDDYRTEVLNDFGMTEQEYRDFEYIEDEDGFDASAFIKIAADDISELRPQDVFRVIDESGEWANEVADYIREHRPDLEPQIEDAFEEIAGDWDKDDREHDPEIEQPAEQRAVEDILNDAGKSDELKMVELVTVNGYDVDEAKEMIAANGGQDIDEDIAKNKKERDIAERAGQDTGFYDDRVDSLESKKAKPIEKFQESIKSKYADQLEAFWISEDDRSIELSNVRIKPESQGQGTGTEILNEIKQYATEAGKPIVLSAEADSRKKAKLDAFYKRNEFDKPSARSKDSSLPRHTHVWHPPETENAKDDNELDSPAERSDGGLEGSGEASVSELGTENESVDTGAAVGPIPSEDDDSPSESGSEDAGSDDIAAGDPLPESPAEESGTDGEVPSAGSGSLFPKDEEQPPESDDSGEGGESSENVEANSSDQLEGAARLIDRSITEEGRKVILETDSRHIGHLAEKLHKSTNDQLASSARELWKGIGETAGVDPASLYGKFSRAEIRQAILDIRKANGIEESENSLDGVEVALQSEMPSLSEIKHALENIGEPDEYGRYMLYDPDTDQRIGLAENKNQAVGAFINSVRKKAAAENGIDTSDHFVRGQGYIPRYYKTVRGRYASWLKSHGSSERKLMGTTEADKKKAAAKAAMESASVNIDELNESWDKMLDGDLTADQIKELYNRYHESKSAIRAELESMTKPQMLERFGLPTKQKASKPKVVDYLMSKLGNRFESIRTAGSMQGFSWTFGEDVDAKKKSWMNELTDEHVATFAEQVRKNTENAKAEAEEFKKSLENPETLDQFRQFVEHRSYDELTDEQKVDYDKLEADEARSNRKEREIERKGTVKQISSDVGGFELSTNFHSKRGIDIYTASPVNRVERDQYNDMNRKAKQLGGWYYKPFRGTPGGFHFPTEDARSKFVSLLEGDVDRSADLAEENREKELSTSQRFAELADRWEEQAYDKFNQDRKENTARRAGMAESARADASYLASKAQTMREIGNALERGEAEYLDGVSAGTHIGTLDSLLYNARWRYADHTVNQEWNDENDRSNVKRYAGAEELRGEAFDAKHVPHVEYPYPSIFKEELSQLESILKGRRGFRGDLNTLKGAGTTDKEYGRWVSIRTQYQWESFKNIVNKLRSLKGLDKDTKWQVDRLVENLNARSTNFKRLHKMGIQSPAELRTALRQYLPIRGEGYKEDPIRKAELKLAGRKLGNGYFPTPPSIGEGMIMSADIQPGHKVLEPSAGKGNLMDIVSNNHPDADLFGVEMNRTLHDILTAKGHQFTGGDFLDHDGEYDRIVMNPPWGKEAGGNVDIDHVKHAYDLLKEGGRIVTLVGAGSMNADARSSKVREFAEWLDEVGASSEPLPPGSFAGDDADVKTSANMHVVVIDK